MMAINFTSALNNAITLYYYFLSIPIAHYIGTIVVSFALPFFSFYFWGRTHTVCYIKIRFVFSFLLRFGSFRRILLNMFPFLIRRLYVSQTGTRGWERDIELTILYIHIGRMSGGQQTNNKARLTNMLNNKQVEEKCHILCARQEK